MESNISMQQLKEQRLTSAEKFVLDKIKGVKASEPDADGSVNWCKDGEWLFTQDFEDSCLYFSLTDINTPLRRYHSLSDDEIKQLLTKLLHKYTNNRQLKIQI
jgi:hypothetical protein